MLSLRLRRNRRGTTRNQFFGGVGNRQLVHAVGTYRSGQGRHINSAYVKMMFTITLFKERHLLQFETICSYRETVARIKLKFIIFKVLPPDSVHLYQTPTGATVTHENSI